MVCPPSFSCDASERERVYLPQQSTNNNKPILHNLGGLPEGHTPITAGYPHITKCTHWRVVGSLVEYINCILSKL